MARTRCPGLRVVFIGSSRFEKYTEGLGELMERPIKPRDLRHTVERLARAAHQVRRVRVAFSNGGGALLRLHAKCPRPVPSSS
jgi:hypothetical protein